VIPTCIGFVKRKKRNANCRWSCVSLPRLWGKPKISTGQGPGRERKKVKRGKAGIGAAPFAGSAPTQVLRLNKPERENSKLDRKILLKGEDPKGNRFEGG